MPAETLAAPSNSTETATPPPSNLSTNDPLPSGFMDQVDSELAELDDNTPAKKQESKKSEKQEQPKEKQEKKTDVKPPEKTADQTPKDSEKPKEIKKEATVQPEDKPTPDRMSLLRKAYEELKPRAKTLASENQTLKEQIKTLESRKPEDNKPLLDKLTAAEKRRDELESEIKFINYSKSSEFREKYSKPYEEAWSRAVSDFNQLMVKIPDGVDEGGEPKFKTRKATSDDLIALANMPLSEMDDKAEQMFGRSSARVIRHVEKVRELSTAQQEALEKAQKESASREKLTTIQQQEEQKKRFQLWNTANETLAKKYPKWFSSDESDPEGNKLLEKGFALADRVFSPTPETAPKTTDEAVRLHALVRNKVANHDRLVFRLKSANAKIKELQDALSEYEKSTPESGRTSTTKPVKSKSFQEEIESEIEALDKPQ